MEIKTKELGLVNIDEKQIIFFPEGILGMEDYKNFALLDANNPPYFFLQSLDDSNLMWVLISPEFFRKDYTLDVQESELFELGLQAGVDTELIVFSIVHFAPMNNLIYANLQAPIVINKAKSLGRQCVSVNPKWKLRHNILEELKKTEGDL